jgi:hypothetical protein
MPAGHTMGLLGGYSLARSFAWGKGLLKGRVATLPSCVKQTSRLTTCEDVAERPSDVHETGSNGVLALLPVRTPHKAKVLRG